MKWFRYRYFDGTHPGGGEGGKGESAVIQSLGEYEQASVFNNLYQK